MYCRYAYDAGATYANFVADMVKLFTGETSLSNLSAQCNLARSELITTVPAGWSLHDAAPGGNFQVLKAPWADNLGYKYAKVGSLLDSGSPVNICHGYETWDATSHAGTGLSYLSDSGIYAQRFDPNGSGVLYLFSSARFMMMLGVTASGLVGGSTFMGPSGLFEHTRAMPWCTADNQVGPWGWTNFAWYGSYDTGFSPIRCKRRSSGLLETGCNLALGVPGGHGITSSLGSGYPEHSLADTTTMAVPMYPLILTGIAWDQASNGGVSGYHGNLSSVCDVWGIQTGSLSLGDTLSWNNHTYVALLNAANVNIIARKE
ncbi:MAG: hypothetical protein HQL84_10070 [Magnetococcales bacterium]|nr:hypothetical protein [Magnetococcales bacterium]MBF0150377.1 hypothetical protein [Magnetococcales bacterium]MBF0631577.1 hypothetical protein [Magnetococcales bacterium]